MRTHLTVLVHSALISVETNNTLQVRTITVHPRPVRLTVPLNGLLINELNLSIRSINVNNNRNLTIISGEGKTLKAALEFLSVNKSTIRLKKVVVSTTDTKAS